MQDALLPEESERFEDSPERQPPRRMPSSEHGPGLDSFPKATSKYIKVPKSTEEMKNT